MKPTLNGEEMKTESREQDFNPRYPTDWEHKHQFKRKLESLTINQSFSFKKTTDFHLHLNSVLDSIFFWI